MSGKIEWNLTSAQIKVKKEEQKKLKKEEEMKRKYDNETDLWSKGYQPTILTTAETKMDPVLSPEDSVHFKRVQLPLLDVRQKFSSSGNYSFLRKFKSYIALISISILKFHYNILSIVSNVWIDFI